MTAVALVARPVGLKPHEKENCMPGKGDAQEMAEGFAPSEFDVLVGWARQNFHHAGNRRFRGLINENVPRYTKADSKISRGHIISEIVKEMQLSSPSGTGFLKMNPYTARWSFIGTDKAKDKVGHALRKALMASEEGNRDESSGSNEDKHESDDSQRQPRGGNNNKRRTNGPASPVVSKKRKDSFSVPHHDQHPTFMHFKDGDVSSILSKSPRYTHQGSLTVDTVASASVNTAGDLMSFSRLFTSPAGPSSATRNQQSSSSGAEQQNPSFVLGLSPVARDMFDDKNESCPDESSSRRRSRTKVVASDTSRISLQRNMDEVDHAADGAGGSISYPAEQHSPSGGIIPPPPGAHSLPLHHRMYGAPPPPPPGGYYYPPPSSPSPGDHRAPLPPPLPLPGGGGGLPPPHPMMMMGGAPGGGGSQPPPPLGMYYQPPGYYYYPGYPMPPPPPGGGAARSTAPHHPHHAQQPFYPPTGGPPPYYYGGPHHPHHHQGENEDGEEGGSSGGSS